MTLPGDLIVGSSEALSPNIVIGDPVYLGITTIVPPDITDDNIGYIYNQPTPLATWTINHTFTRYPSITVIDSSGFVILTDVEYPNNSMVVLTFAQPISGKALLT